MSHGHSQIGLHDVPALALAEPWKAPQWFRPLMWFLMAAGAVFVAWGALSAEPARAWVVFQVNFVFWYCLAAASTCFAAVLHITNAQWARPFRRIFESTGNYFLWSLLPLGVMYWWGCDHIFVWVHESVPGKELWLTRNFVYERDALVMLGLALLARWHVFLSLRQDVIAVRSGLAGAQREDSSRWFSRYYDRCSVDTAADGRTEIDAAHVKKSYLSPVIVLVYALGMSLFAFDQLMSIDPLWYSTLFGVFIFMSAVYAAMAWCALGTHCLASTNQLLREKLAPSSLHDLGKLLFGFGIFWAYLFWSHYLTIWYGNLPEETGFIIARLRLQPWHSLAWTVLGCCFIYPFIFGLSKDVKFHTPLLAVTGLVVGAGVWLQTYLIIAPAIYPNVIPLGTYELVISLGFAAAFGLSAAAFLEKLPLMPFGDLYRSNSDISRDAAAG